ncbi:MAG: hypothetical protein ACRDPI_02720 [Nocardioidaceae bacterium]
MAVFASLARRRSSANASQGSTLTESVRERLPMRFEAVGEGLLGGENVVAACAVVGRDVARDGASLGEALSGLRTTFQVVVGREPDFDATEALSIAWSEATLSYMHDLSCEDPLTGLTSLAHVRTRLSEIYRDAWERSTSVSHRYALVVVEVGYAVPAGGPEQKFTRTLRLVQVTEAVRAVYSGGETIGRLGQERLVAVVPRTSSLGASVATLRGYLEEADLGAAELRLWIEGLPSSGDSASLLLDELAR